MRFREPHIPPPHHPEALKAPKSRNQPTLANPSPALNFDADDPLYVRERGKTRGKEGRERDDERERMRKQLAEQLEKGR